MPSSSEIDAGANGPAVDFSANLMFSSRDWRRRVLTPPSGPRVNYTIVASWADVTLVKWVASRDVWFPGSSEATMDRLVVGGEGGEGARGGGIEGSEKQWLSRGQDGPDIRDEK
ncbi:hypothetical protein E4U54_006103 [Claviceps lovelessii]|nr:hypothetical protein E4U54_006103 [Claviceps lovelessii]